MTFACGISIIHLETPPQATLHYMPPSNPTFFTKSSSDFLGSASHVTQIGSHFASETFRWFKVYFGYMIKGGCIGVGFEWGVGYSTPYLTCLETMLEFERRTTYCGSLRVKLVLEPLDMPRPSMTPYRTFFVQTSAHAMKFT